jgi:hypothetical protein
LPINLNHAAGSLKGGASAGLAANVAIRQHIGNGRLQYAPIKDRSLKSTPNIKG